MNKILWFYAIYLYNMERKGEIFLAAGFSTSSLMETTSLVLEMDEDKLANLSSTKIWKRDIRCKRIII